MFRHSAFASPLPSFDRSPRSGRRWTSKSKGRNPVAGVRSAGRAEVPPLAPRSKRNGISQMSILLNTFFGGAASHTGLSARSRISGPGGRKPPLPPKKRCSYNVLIEAPLRIGDIAARKLKFEDGRVGLPFGNIEAGCFRRELEPPKGEKVRRSRSRPVFDRAGCPSSAAPGRACIRCVPGDVAKSGGSDNE